MSYKVALIGNMNNNFFAITRYLRDNGFDAHLFYRVGMEHFQPLADTYSQDYHSYCHEVNWLDNGFHNANENIIRQNLEGFSFFIGQGDEAAIAYKAGFNMDVYYPYGSDVYKYASLPHEYNGFQKLKGILRLNKKLSYQQMRVGTAAKYMNGVIVNARNVLAEYTNEDFEQKLLDLSIKGSYKNYPMPFIYYKEYEEDSRAKSNINLSEEIQNIRTAYDFIVLYHGRQEWKTVHNDFTGKNTHHLIIGFAGFVKQHPGKKVCLIMLEYGSDTEYSKQLIEKLGITDSVKWFPKMYRKDLMYLISNVDVCTGEFGRSYLTFGTIIEAMIMKKPVVHHREDELYKQYEVLYPMLNAKEPDEIATVLTYAFNNPDVLVQMGDEAHDWVKKYFISQPLEYLLSLITEKQRCEK